MIRGPVLPQLRERLWSLVSTRLERIESGLSLVLEGLDCSDGQLGLVEGLARDTLGAPVLVLLAVEGDPLLPARALAAGTFLQRVGDALVRAVPEARFCPGTVGRVLLVGTESAAGLLELVCTLPIARIQACSLEPFRIAGSERFAVRWVSAQVREATPADADRAVDAGALGLPEHPAFVAPAGRADLWAQLQSICERIDAGVRVDGDRYLRQITWNGAALGEVRTEAGALLASAATGVVRELRSHDDVRCFGDQLLRAYVREAGLDLADVNQARAAASSEPTTDRLAAPRQGEAVDDRSAATRHAASARGLAPNGESLRSSLAAARLSPEEYSALGEPASVAGAMFEESVVAENRQQAPSPGGKSVPFVRPD